MGKYPRLSWFLPVILALSVPSGPAWAAPDCSRRQGSLPNPALPPGTADQSNPVEHVVVIMQENHSFDSFFGMLGKRGYGNQVDGLVPELMSNPDSDGSIVHPFPLPTHCVADTDHSWNAAHVQYDGGRNDGFVTTNNSAKSQNGYRAMGYYDQPDMPFLYALANRFAIADRYFSSVLSETYPNRFFMYAATAFGNTRNKLPVPFVHYSQRTIFDVLDENQISWSYYYTDVPAMILFQPAYWRNLSHLHPVSRYHHDLHHGKLPQVTFVEQSMILGDEHPPIDFQISQHAVNNRIQQLIESPYWDRSVLFLTYDENGGYYDHVPPPAACAPDGIAPQLDSHDTYPGAYDRLGFRVPFVAISPFVKRHYVSHVTYDHTSILKYIETKFNLPALSRRDANADGMADLFDYAHPQYDVPELPENKMDMEKFWACFTKKGREIPRPTESSGLN